MIFFNGGFNWYFDSLYIFTLKCYLQLLCSCYCTDRRHNDLYHSLLVDFVSFPANYDRTKISQCVAQLERLQPTRTLAEAKASKVRRIPRTTMERRFLIFCRSPSKAHDPVPSLDPSKPRTTNFADESVLSGGYCYRYCLALVWVLWLRSESVCVP